MCQVPDICRIDGPWSVGRVKSVRACISTKWTTMNMVSSAMPERIIIENFAKFALLPSSSSFLYVSLRFPIFFPIDPFDSFLDDNFWLILRTARILLCVIMKMMCLENHAWILCRTIFNLRFRLIISQNIDEENYWVAITDEFWLLWDRGKFLNVLNALNNSGRKLWKSKKRTPSIKSCNSVFFPHLPRL